MLITTDTGTTLFDPGFYTFDSGEVDLEGIGDVQQVMITHEHGDHVKPEFVQWLIDRSPDVVVHSNREVAELLARSNIEVLTGEIPGATFEDVLHEPIPTGATPPNRAYTVDRIFTHPGDSQQIAASAPVMALPLMAPWTSLTAAVAFATRVGPAQVFPIHDFFMSSSGRAMIGGMAKTVLGAHGIELVQLDWGDSFSV